MSCGLAVIVLLLGSLALSPSHALLFPKLSLACDDANHSHCPRGQHCDEFHCTPNKIFKREIYSLDGRCGPDFDDTVCDPYSVNYSGGCCSTSGWCGSSYDHCVLSCVSGCLNTTETTVPSSGSVSVDGRCGADFFDTVCPAGECCSPYGYCGSTSDYCVFTSHTLSSAASVPKSASSSLPTISTVSTMTALYPNTTVGDSVSTSGEPVMGIPSVTTVSAAAESTLPVTTDGTCGLANGGIVCGDWSFGNCCSQYGYCGNSSSHCGSGCQSGDCLEPYVVVPGEIAANVATGNNAGSFTIVGQSGVPAMHAALLPNGNVVFLDKVEDYTQVMLPSGYFAYSSEYNPNTNTYVPLAYKTNSFCAGGSYLANGDLISVGGNADLPCGFDGIRYLKRTTATENVSDWSEPGNKLDSSRWYPSVQNLANGEIFVASGSLNGLDPSVPDNNNPTWELLDKTGKSISDSIPMYILAHNQPYYMYPFIHLLRSGELFIFVSKSCEIFDVSTNKTIAELPDLPGDYRTYPNTGGSVLLPLSSNDNYEAEIMICGGGSYQDISSPTDASCGRIRPESTKPTWTLEGMPYSRDMVEAILLPDGTSIWLNGGHYGAQGFNLSREPVLEALQYDPAAQLGSRFTVLASSTIPRLYHSVALLIPDGTILVAGSNPVEMPVLQATEYTPYVTEFRVEIFTPPYLMGNNRAVRPANLSSSSSDLATGDTFTLTYTEGKADTQDLKVVLYHGGFVTHSVHMGHRMIYLDNSGFISGQRAGYKQTLTVSMPPYDSVTPPAPYLLFVVADGIPSVGKAVYVNRDSSF